MEEHISKDILAIFSSLHTKNTNHLDHAFISILLIQLPNSTSCLMSTKEGHPFQLPLLHFKKEILKPKKFNPQPNLRKAFV